jgi:hypothetical protein
MREVLTHSQYSWTESLGPDAWSLEVRSRFMANHLNRNPGIRSSARMHAQSVASHALVQVQPSSSWPQVGPNRVLKRRRTTAGGLAAVCGLARTLDLL